MAVTNTARIAFSVVATSVKSGTTGKGPVVMPIELTSLRLPNGTDVGEIDLAYYKKETGIGSGVTTVYDLAGVLTDKDGNTISFAEVSCIAIRNLSATATNYLEVGPDSTNGFGVLASNIGFWKDASDRNIVTADYDSSSGDGGWFIIGCRTGVPVSGGSTDELAVITGGSASAATWEVMILGRST